VVRGRTRVARDSRKEENDLALNHLDRRKRGPHPRLYLYLGGRKKSEIPPPDGLVVRGENGGSLHYFVRGKEGERVEGPATTKRRKNMYHAALRIADANLSAAWSTTQKGYNRAVLSERGRDTTPCRAPSFTGLERRESHWNLPFVANV